MPNENIENADSTNSEEGNEPETIAIPKADYEKMNQTLGSLKRELKDLKKPKEEPIENKKPEESVLLQKLERVALRQAGLTHQDDIELARNTAKKWGVDIDEVLLDEDFKVKLERQQTTRDNLIATTNIKGGGQGTGQAKNTPEYWIAKGVPPTTSDVTDKKAHAKIIREMMKTAKTGGKKFYND